MTLLASAAGLSPDFPSPEDAGDVVPVVTEEAAVRTPGGAALPVTPLVQQGDLVTQGAPVACLRHAPDVYFVAPIHGHVARMSLLPGRKLSEIILFREPGTDGVVHDVSQADTQAGLRRLMQAAGVWPWLRRRPFGGMPAPDEHPAAIAVMALDTRPLAPDPRRALEGRAEAFARGLRALTSLTDGPVLLFQRAGDPPLFDAAPAGRVQVIRRGARHPQGAAGIGIHAVCPAGPEAPVWDLHAEDVAALGTLLETGTLPMLRRVRVAGAGLRTACTVLTHPGADLRQLTRRHVAPGPHMLISGSPLDGHAAQWLAPRHRQVTVLPRAPAPARQHWLRAALTRSAGMRPAIPTAALTQAFGAALPAAAFVRALGAGDDETMVKLGILSLLEEDVALPDYVLSGGGALPRQLRDVLDRIRSEVAA